MSAAALLVLAGILLIFTVALGVMNADARRDSDDLLWWVAWGVAIASAISFVLAAVTAWPA